MEKQGDEPGRLAEPFHEQGQALVDIAGLRAAVELPQPQRIPALVWGSLNPHFHVHVVVLEGVFTETDDGVRFDEATHVCAADAG